MMMLLICYGILIIDLAPIDNWFQKKRRRKERKKEKERERKKEIP